MVTDTSNSLTDEALAAEALTDPRAFNQLAQRHHRRLFRFLSRTSSNPADVEDAMQQAFVKAYTKLHQFNPKFRFTTWLFTIALRELRVLSRRATTAMSIDHAAEPADRRPQRDSFESVDLWGQAKRVLNRQQFTTLWLRYGEDLPPRDIARVMRRPRVWVSVTIHRACAILRDALPADDGPAMNSQREATGVAS